MDTNSKSNVLVGAIIAAALFDGPAIAGGPMHKMPVDNGKAFPSYVAITADGQMLIGEPARRQAAANPEGTATAFKRKMGQRETIRLRDHEFTPEQLSAFLLQKMEI